MERQACETIAAERSTKAGNGIANEQMGEIEKAIACHEKCLELDQGFLDAQASLKK